jgi:hypothetical protein
VVIHLCPKSDLRHNLEDKLDTLVDILQHKKIIIQLR